MISKTPQRRAHAVSETDSRHDRPAHQNALHLSVLALNRNYLAVHVIPVRRAFYLLFKELAEVVSVESGRYASYDFDGWREMSELRLSLGERAAHEDWIRAVNFEIQAPRVIRLLRYDRLPGNTIKFNRRNIFLRDEHRCQYCGKRYSSTRLSLDHVLPRSRGGKETWENIVCACLTCNVRKGHRTPTEAGMTLLRAPVKPPRSPLISRHLSSEKYTEWHPFVPGAVAETSYSH